VSALAALSFVGLYKRIGDFFAAVVGVDDNEECAACHYQAQLPVADVSFLVYSLLDDVEER
jgi:hypothetical protein